ncbi:MAG: Rrf2 family transcriptional regulator [Deltaproteobacteria bacterium CG_4_8_14_3_um_filter_45_9]|jgi:Rrf2 family protein|nr:MAG: Rrf2 family transcriptional regulator [Deltaproteobacteria bacterium CG03_land_8_20_14_0_80_45_14]PIX25625.1 MAG: Rrf2 family transcriptional regulator [Deltaproteobacteria bacterium CG_4_8_14_3_um_filter_45_9]
MRLSTQSRYGVRAIFDIAYHSEGLGTQVKDISRRQGISQRYLEQIFQKLKRAGIVGSKRGPSGGYFLNKKPEDITVGEVIRITEGGINPVLCVNPEDSSQPCEKSGECVTQIVWNEAGKRLKDYFDSITIRDLCKLAKEMGLKKDLDKRFMYYI